MSPSAPARFLIGSRSAILELASWRWTLLLGLVLVATAGVARHYDDHSGLSGIAWLLGPIIISAFSSLIVFFAAEAALGFSAAHGKSLARGYLAFLGLFWMTAPCAWIYAIPVEHWNDPLGAAKWNVTFLGFVAAWRVAIMARACQVISGQSGWRSLCAVLCPAGLEFFVVSFFLNIDRSLVVSMGGVREVTELDKFLLAVHSNGMMAGLILALAAGIGIGIFRRTETAPQSDSTKRNNAARSGAESDL